MARRRWRWRAAFRMLWLAPPVVIGGMWARSCRTMDEVSAVDADGVLRAAVSYGGAVHWVRAENNATQRPAAWDTYDAPPGAAWAAMYSMDDLEWRRLGFAVLSSRPLGAPARAPANVAAANTGAANPGAANAAAANAGGMNGGAANAAAVDAGPVNAGGGNIAPPNRRERGRPGGRSAARRAGAAAGGALAAAPTPPRQLAPWLFTRPYKAYALPYWFPLAVTSIPAAATVLRMIRRHSRRRRGLCPGCGYDLRATPGRCPECGEEGVGERAGAPRGATSTDAHLD